MNPNDTLSDVCLRFIKARHSYSSRGHESKVMFSVTSPFTDLEGLRLPSSSNCIFDFISYEPTLDHVFLDEASLEGFERYLDAMFCEADKLEDWSYFKILSNVDSAAYQHFTDIVKTGRFGKQSADSDYRVPISLISVAEFHLFENCSRMYTVKCTNIPLERSNIRVKLNTYFRVLMSLLNCSEDDVLDVLYRKGILPSKDFKLISTQKELTIALKRYRSSGLQERFEKSFVSLELIFGILKPKYVFPNTNLCQALQLLFGTHPWYFRHQQNLLIATNFIGNGKGHLDHAVQNRKRKHLIEKTEQMLYQPKKSKEQTETCSNPSEDNVLATAMRQYIPELYLPPDKKYLTIDIDREIIPSVLVFSLSDENVKILTYPGCDIQV